MRYGDGERTTRNEERNKRECYGKERKKIEQIRETRTKKRREMKERKTGARKNVEGNGKKT